MERVVTSYKNPDLDGVACMYAYSEFLNKTGVKSSYCIIGNVKEEVKIVCDIFNIKLNSKKTIDKEDEIVIVDNHDLNNFKNHDTNKIVEIIDHHTVYNGVTFPEHIKTQIDIIGAAATIVTERFIKANIDITKESAILLYYGIISNSINLKSSVTDIRDINACNWLESKYSEITKSKIKEIFVKKSQIKDSNLRKMLEIEHTINLLDKNINIGVLEIANVEEFINNKLNQINLVINDVKKDYNPDIIFINCIDILNGYNIILCNDKNTEEFLNKIFKFNVQNGIYKTDKIVLRKELIRKLIKLDKYLNQDIDNPIYLFHGSPKRISKLTPQQSHDSNGNVNNIANAIFLFPSFLKATPYAFKDTIKENSEGLHWNFEIPNNNGYPLMIMDNVNVECDIVGYIYVFEKDKDMIKDENSYQYKCYKELVPIDIIEVNYSDYSNYYEVRNNKNKREELIKYGKNK